MLSCIESHQNQNALASRTSFKKSYTSTAQKIPATLHFLALMTRMKKKLCTLTRLAPNAASKCRAKVSFEELMNLTKEARPESTVAQNKMRMVKHE